MSAVTRGSCERRRQADPDFSPSCATLKKTHMKSEDEGQRRKEEKTKRVGIDSKTASNSEQRCSRRTTPKHEHADLVGPSSRVCMVASAGPKSLGVFSLTFFSFPFSFFFPEYGGQFHTVEFECDKLCLISECISFPVAHPIFFTRPVHGNFPSFSTIVPPSLMFPSCVVTWIFFHRSCLRGLPPPCTSPSVHAFQGVGHRIGSFITDLHTERVHPSVPMSSWPCCRLLHDSRPMFLLFVFQTGEDET